MEGCIRILIVHEPGFVRDALVSSLAARTDLDVMGAVTDESPMEGSSAPDVIILDASLGRTERLDALKKRWPAARILALHYASNQPASDTGGHPQIDGHLYKTHPSHRVLGAIGAGVRGQPVRFWPGEAGSGPDPASPAPRPPERGSLTEREREVMQGIANGYRTREIATQLSLSHKTVEKHRTTLMRKLGVRTAAAVAAYAISRGYVVL